MFRRVPVFVATILIVGLAGSASAQPQLPGMGTAVTQAPPPQSVPAAPSQSLPAAEYWATIRGSNDPAAFEGFLQRYPNHAFAALARTKLDTLRGQGGAGQQTVTTQPVQPQPVIAPPADGPRSIFGTPAAQPAVPGPQLASDLQTALKNLNCYTSRVDGDWGRGSRAALQRFNAMSGAALPTDVPTQEALVNVTNWSGGNCKVVATRKVRKVRKKKTTKTYKKPPPSGGSGGGIGISIGGGGIGIGF